jgi:hypothetical protein
MAKNTYYLQYDPVTFAVVSVSYLRTFHGKLPKNTVKLDGVTDKIPQFIADEKNLYKKFNPEEKKLYDEYGVESKGFQNKEQVTK